MQKFLDDTPVFAPVTGAVVRPLPEIVTARFVCETIGESTRLARQRDSRSLDPSHLQSPANSTRPGAVHAWQPAIASLISHLDDLFG